MNFALIFHIGIFFMVYAWYLFLASVLDMALFYLDEKWEV